MLEQALIPTQLFVSAPSWECRHLMDVEAQDKVGMMSSEGMAIPQGTLGEGLCTVHIQA